MDDSSCIAFDIELESNTVAYSSSDGVLRVWESETAVLKNEFLPSAHLSATCTCIRWRQKKRSSAAIPSSQKKKRGRKVVAEPEERGQQDDSDMVAVGSSAGDIYLYSTSKGAVQCQLKTVHTASVADLCWSTDCSSLYSGHADGVILQWDTIAAKQIGKWKCSKSGLSSLSLCGSKYLISASRSISIWNLKTHSEEKSFTGHATDIIKVHSVTPDSEVSDLASVHLVSVARDDRVVSLWSPSSKSIICKRAKASFILDNEPSYSSLHYDRDSGSIQLAVQTIAATVELFTQQLNGITSKKPLKPACTITLCAPTGTSLPVLVANLATAHRLLIMYGTAVCPAFDNLELDSIEQGLVELKREDPSCATTVTRVTSVGNVRKPKIDGAVTTLTPAVEGGRKPGAKKTRNSLLPGKRSLEEAEITIGERLTLLRGASGDKSGVMAAPLESLAALLSQGLQSDDANILNNTLKTSDPKVINTTIRRLPLTCVMPLMKHLTVRLEAFGSGAGGSGAGGSGGVVVHTSLIKWVRALLHIHASYLATFPELMERLQMMYSIMENRVSQLGTFTRLQGRLELMLSHIARQKDDDQSIENSAALLTLQDESSEDEMVDDLDMMMVHSESEDGYLSADEDDLVK